MDTIGDIYVRCNACDLLTFDPRTGRCTVDDCWGSEEPEWQAADVAYEMEKDNRI